MLVFDLEVTTIGEVADMELEELEHWNERITARAKRQRYQRQRYPVAPRRR